MNDIMLKSIINEQLNIKQLPKEVSISTITLSCKLDIILEPKKIAEEIELSENEIIEIHYGNIKDEKTNRTLCKKIKKQKKAFYNGLTLKIIVNNKKKPINIKAFINGSFQITGCKNVDNIIDVLTIIINRLKKNQVYLKQGYENLDINKIYNFKIALINSDYNINFKIDLQNLQNILPPEIQRTYNVLRHSCVNIKYYINKKMISIFVFNKGSIIITGSVNCEQIRESYNYIDKLLVSNYKDIVDNNHIYKKIINKYLIDI